MFSGGAGPGAGVQQMQDLAGPSPGALRLLGGVSRRWRAGRAALQGSRSLAADGTTATGTQVVTGGG